MAATMALRAISHPIRGACTTVWNQSRTISIISVWGTCHSIDPKTIPCWAIRAVNTEAAIKVISSNRTKIRATMAVCGRGDLVQMVSNNRWFEQEAPGIPLFSIFTECSVKSSEGFRLHKAVVRFVYNVPTVTECERMCHAESKFRCVTYSYRYSPLTRDNCLLCDRPLGHLDYYSGIESGKKV